MNRALSPVIAMLVGTVVAAAEPAPTDVLRVCADPDNLPHSHADGSGFEDRIARLLAREMGVQ